MSRYKDNWGNQPVPGWSDEDFLSQEFTKKFYDVESAERSRQLAKDPTWLNNVRQAAKRWSSDPKWIEAQAKRNADLVSRPDWPEIKARATETLKKRWQEDAEFRERMQAKNAEVTSSPEWLEAVCQGVAEANERYWASPEAQAERSRIAKKAAAKRDNAAIGEKHRQRFIDNPELRKESSERSKALRTNPVVRNKWEENYNKAMSDPKTAKAREEGSAEYHAWLKTDEGKKVRSEQQKQNWINHKDSMTLAIQESYAKTDRAKKVSEGLKNSQVVKAKAKLRQNKIKTPDGIFESRKAAAEFYGMKCPTGMNTRMKNHPDKYYYIKVGNGATKIKDYKVPKEVDA